MNIYGEKIKSNRSINQSLNVISKKNKLPFSFKPFQNLIVHNKWDSNCFMILDILTDYIYHKHYQHINPNSCYSPDVQSRIPFVSFEDFEEFRNDNKFEFLIPDKELFSMYPFLKKYSSTNLFDIFTKTSDCCFSLDAPCRFFTGKNGTQKVEVRNINIDCKNIFNIEVLKEIKYSDDTRVKNRIYKVCFVNIFGIIFMQNILSLNFQFINTRLYNLSKTTQNIYRKLILHKNMKTIQISFLSLKIALSYENNNSTICNTIFENCFKELVEHKFIESFEINGRGSNRIYLINQKG